MYSTRTSSSPVLLVLTSSLMRRSFLVLVAFVAMGLFVQSMAFAVGPRDVVVKEYPGETLTLEYEDGYLVKETSSRDGVETTTSYQYIDGRLVMCTTVDSSSGVSHTVFFLRSPYGNELVAVKRDGVLTYTEDSFVIQNGQRIDTSSFAELLAGNYDTNENGDMVIVDGDYIYEYSVEGALLRKIGLGSTVEYLYEDDVLVGVRTTFDDGGFSYGVYEQGVLSSLEEFDASGAISSRTVYGKEGTGKVRTLYDSGRPVANVYYREDNRRVDRIEYL